MPLRFKDIKGAAFTVLNAGVGLRRECDGFTDLEARRVDYLDVRVACVGYQQFLASICQQNLVRRFRSRPGRGQRQPAGEGESSSVCSQKSGTFSEGKDRHHTVDATEPDKKIETRPMRQHHVHDDQCITRGDECEFRLTIVRVNLRSAAKVL